MSVQSAHRLSQRVQPTRQTQSAFIDSFRHQTSSGIESSTAILQINLVHFQCNVCLRSFSRRAHLREHQKAHDLSQTNQSLSANRASSAVSNTISINKTDFITIYDCQNCSNLFASESDLKKHSCVINVVTDNNPNKSKKSSKNKANSKKGLVTVSGANSAVNSSNSKPSKSKPSSVNATLTTAVLGDSENMSEQMTPKDSSNSEFTFQFHDGLDDNIPTAHIEIITAPVDIGSAFSPIVTIDGIQYPTIPILTNTIETEDDNELNKDEMSTKLLLTTTGISSLK